MTYKYHSNKYHNKKTIALDGSVFDSLKEARRWDELLLLQRARKITDLQRQVEYELIPAQYETYERRSANGKRLKDGSRLIERKCSYVADFVYTDTETGKTVVEDAKGVRTKEYIIKRKLMLAIHGIRIHEV